MMMHAMDCTALDERLADYLEGDLDPATHRQAEAHVASCVRCSALVRDLDEIRAGAADLPELTPSTDLWSGIARRIDTPVLPFVERSAPPVPNVATRGRSFDRFKRAAIAAALVVVTAGVTYTLTVAQRGGGTASSTLAGNRPAASNPAATSGTDSARIQPLPASEPSTGGAVAPTAPGSEPTRPQSQPVLDAPGAATYSHEIDQLRTLFARNRAQLDPRTAAIIETNLKVIDEAIAQSKAALAQDPASRFLNKQLNSALDKKLELLRTAALLPNRT